jgi:hypothetical protein
MNNIYLLLGACVATWSAAAVQAGGGGGGRGAPPPPPAPALMAMPAEKKANSGTHIPAEIG